MASLDNIFCSSNPAKLLDALWNLIGRAGNDFSDYIIFLPSRRAVRSLEKFLVDKVGSAVLLPMLVPLGEGALADEDEEDVTPPDVISTNERVLILAKLLTADPNVRTISNALPIARDLVRMQDYLENEGVNSADIDWLNMIDEKYAAHFRQKAWFLDIVTRQLPIQTNNQITSTRARNDAIRAWANNLDKYSRVIVCGSTASVPATADLMVHIAGLQNGLILLPGKISGRIEDFELNTNPYNSEYKFLKRVGVRPCDVRVIDIGASDIDFFNFAFSNIGGGYDGGTNAQLIECARESEEADAVAEIAARATQNKKSVLVITPDAAGNQRIAVALSKRGLIADFSGGVSGTATLLGRALLNLFDDWCDSGDNPFDSLYQKNDFDLFKTLVHIVDSKPEIFAPNFQIDSDDAAQIWPSIQEMSDVLTRNNITLSITDARAIVMDALSGVSIRSPMMADAQIAVLGTIESRMQTADVVILTGLNEGMFPAHGYENAWIPRAMAEQIGLPSPNRKVSLMALDFMNLSCGSQIYWLRSKTAGSSHTTTSRFLSRVDVTNRGIARDVAYDILGAVRKRDEIEYRPLDYSSPRPPADRSDVYVTELELLTHNPYAYYVRHMLRLKPMDDYWQTADARDFGNLVHNVIEHGVGKTATELVFEMDRLARDILPMGSVLFHFWHKRFVEIAPAIADALNSTPGAKSEVSGQTNIAGRIVRARADRIGDGFVMDIKTGGAPSKKQLEEGNMPQLPLTAYMLKNGGFNIRCQTSDVVMQFLQLQNNNVKLIEYRGDIATMMIENTVAKISGLFGRYSNDFEPYEYYETSDPKYRAYDDLARVDD